MKTADKAATVVAEFLNGNDVAANTITQRLANAGLLAPDLPEPGEYESGEVEWATIDGYVNVEDGLIVVAHDERVEDDTPERDELLWPEPGKIKFLNPANAEYLGRLLIAAARVQKQRNS